MKKWNLIIDVENCTNCNLCVLSSQDEHVGNSFPDYSEKMPKRGARWIDIKRKERGQIPMIDVAYLPTMCQHCDNAPCIKASKNNAIIKRPDGIVIIDPVKSKGQKQIVDSCPYGSISWNDELEIPQIWFFDAHLLDDGWKEPRAASVCATEAIVAKKIDDKELNKLINDEKLEVLNPEFDTKPRVYYKNLYRYNKCFIGGSVYEKVNGIEDCSSGITVRIYHNNKLLNETLTDSFGDFKFDHLVPDSGHYRIDLIKDNKEKSVDVYLKESVNLGSFLL